MRETQLESPDRVALDEAQLMGFDRLTELSPKSVVGKGDVDRLALAGRLFSKVGTVEA